MFHFFCAFCLCSYCFCCWMHSTPLPQSPIGGLCSHSDRVRDFMFLILLNEDLNVEPSPFVTVRIDVATKVSVALLPVTQSPIYL